MATKVVQLSDGNTMPIVGLGTWDSFKGVKGEIQRSVESALENGYRHIDCAYLYGNENEAGEGINNKIKDGTVKREQLFVTTKPWLTFHRPGIVKQCLKKSLENLKLDYVDLFIMHWPCGLQPGEANFPKTADNKLAYDDVDFVQTWLGLEECKRLGLARSIGVSNFNVNQLKRLMAVANYKPVVNQIESHPYLNQPELRKYCNENNIHITAYSPLGGGSAEGKPKLLEDPLVKELAEKYGKSTGQILIRYQIQLGNSVIPKSATPSRIKSNFDVYSFALSTDDMQKLQNLDKNYRYMLFEPLKNHPYFPF